MEIEHNQSWMIKLESLTQEIAKSCGCELYDLEVVGAGAHRVLRVFIDKAETGIGIEDCSVVSKGLNEFLDQNEDFIPGGAYTLEVSSPGLDRQLRKLSHFQKVIGQKIFVQLSQNLGSLGAQEKTIQLTKKFEDQLIDIEQDQLVFKMKSEVVKVPLKVIDKAKLVFEFKKSLKK